MIQKAHEHDTATALFISPSSSPSPYETSECYPTFNIHGSVHRSMTQ